MRKIADTNHAQLTDPHDGLPFLVGELWHDEDEDILYVMPWAKPRKGGGGDPHMHGNTIIHGKGPIFYGEEPSDGVIGDCNLPGSFHCKTMGGRQPSEKEAQNTRLPAFRYPLDDAPHDQPR